MQVFEHADPDALALRSHPWSGSTSDPSHRYYDLRQEPERIRTSLEDLLDWAPYKATERYYRLLESLNGPVGRLETNDCAFTGPARNEHPSVSKAQQCSGRLMLLFRDLALNTDARRVHGLTNQVALGLQAQDPDFPWGVFGATVVPVRFLDLPGPDARQLGSQLMLSFWAWGDDPVDTMANLDRALTGLTKVMEPLNRPD